MIAQILTKTVQRNATNVLRTGVSLLFANLANQVLRDTTRETMDRLRMDVRRIKTELDDLKIARLQARGELI